MKGFLKWGAIIFVGLIVIGAIAGGNSTKTKTQQSSTPAPTTSTESQPAQTTSPSTPKPKPPPDPVKIIVQGPFTTRHDQVTLRGSVTPRSAKVRVNGQRVSVSDGEWVKTVATTHLGDNEVRIIGSKPGRTKDASTATITRKLTIGQEQALRSAKDYLSGQAFSKQGLIEQLSSSAGEGYSLADATFAVAHSGANWNLQAVKAARSYLSGQSFSRSGLIEQLSSQAGEGFTLAQATYAVNKVYR